MGEGGREGVPSLAGSGTRRARLDSRTNAPAARALHTAATRADTLRRRQPIPRCHPEGQARGNHR